MTFAKVSVSGVCAKVEYKKLIPAGLIGGRIEFEFTDSRWDSLRKTVVFWGRETRDVPMEGNTVTIPPEVIAKSGHNLRVGVYGTNVDDTVAIPTLWADLGRICPAADPSGDPAADPTLPIWAQLEERVGDLEENLDTQVESSIKDYLEKNPPSGGVQFETDNTLTLEDGVLSVNTTDQVQEDNRQPITSQAVHEQFETIVALLKTI